MQIDRIELCRGLHYNYRNEAMEVCNMPISLGEYEYNVHPFEPVWDENSRILILGTFPSPKSREYGFYYGHPANRFWRTLSAVLELPEPAKDIESRRKFLLANHIAVWDVLYSCSIIGASDSSIRDPIVNNFRSIISNSKIHTVFTTGWTATHLFNTLAYPEVGIQAQYLPSTSPANGNWGRAKGFDLWKASITRALAK